MGKTKEYGYLQFPLCLIKETYKDITRGLDLILDYGIVNYATKLSYNLQDVAKQVCYSYYRNNGVLQSSIKNTITKAENNLKFTPDEDYNGFSSDTFNPDENISEILKLFEGNPQFKEDCILHYQLHVAASGDHLDIKIYSNDNTILRYNQALRLKNDFEAKFGPDPMPMCKKGILFDFKDNQQKDIELFRAYIGIRSLIGLKNYIATTRNVILMRMLGCKSKKSLLDFIKNNLKAKEVYEKYSRSDKAMDYHFNKLFQKLLLRGFIKSKIFERKVSRKIFLSVNLSYDELANEIIKFSNNRNFKRREDEAISKIRATI